MRIGLCGLAALLVLSTACDDDAAGDPGATSDTAPGFVQLNEAIFKRNCANGACHGGNGISGLSFDDTDAAFEHLVDRAPVNGPAATDGMKLVAPGDPDGSLLIAKLTWSQDELTKAGYGGHMPMTGTEAPGPGSIEAVRAWIAAGAPKNGVAVEADWIPFDSGGQYVQCDATDEAGLRECFPPNADPARFKRVYTPPLTLEPGTEHIFCSRVEVLAESMLVTKAVGMQMTGGHHTAVYTSVAPLDSDEPVECDDINMSSLRFVIAAGGAGGVETKLNDGLALRVGAGEQLVIQSHYINATPETRVVMDAIDIETTTLEAQPQIADSFAMIDSEFEVPPQTDGYERVKECKMDRDVELQLLIGHTHDYGTLFEMELERPGAAPELLYHATDGPTLRDNPDIITYAEPLVVNKDDVLRMRCRWDNPTEAPLGWPEEMCVAFMYYTPGNGWMTCDTDDVTPKVVGEGTGAGCATEADTGNELGVGEYCTPDGDECGDNSAATFCLASFSETNNYCSVILCETDDECGTGASCIADGPGSACIMDHCE